MRFQAEDFFSLDADRAGVGVRRAAQRVEQRGLAGTVRPDDGLYDAAGHVEVDGVERHKAAEPPGHAACGDDRV